MGKGGEKWEKVWKSDEKRRKVGGKVARCGYMCFYVAKSGFMSAILDVRNSLAIAFLATSDRYATLIFFGNF